MRSGVANKKNVCDTNLKSLNELLAVGYFEKRKMGFYGDGEEKLGPTVATLCPGCC